MGNVKCLAAFVILAASGICAGVLAQTTAPLVPTVTADDDGTLHWGPRIVPPPQMASPEVRKLYAETIKRSLLPKPPRPSNPEEARRQMGERFHAFIERARRETLAIYPANVEETEIGGVKVSVYTPKGDIAARNKNRVVMEFEIDAEAIELASVAKMKVISVHYSGGYPQSNADIAQVYRELLKTHKPSQIAMFGLSGGCQLAANTTVWLPEQKLPFPAALGLMTCAGGGMPGDARITLNGIDPVLSDVARGGDLGGKSPNPRRPSVKPGDPPQEILVAEIPKGFPPSYLVTGTRDMSLSEMALLQRKLRHAGVEADLNVFEGLWHSASAEASLPEARDVITDFAHFLDKHMGT